MKPTGTITTGDRTDDQPNPSVGPERHPVHNPTAPAGTSAGRTKAVRPFSAKSAAITLDAGGACGDDEMA
jgi:hypothetical protein